MPVFQRIDIAETELPISDPEHIRICKARGLTLLLGAKIYDSFSISGYHLGLLVPITTNQVINSTENVNKDTKPDPYLMVGLSQAISNKDAPNLWVATDLFISGIFYLDGKIIVNKGKDILVGVYSYQEHKNGFIWGHELKNRCVSL